MISVKFSDILMVDEVRNIRREVLPKRSERHHRGDAAYPLGLDRNLDQDRSRDEDPQFNGISHFVEHMVFKGTKHRSAEEIARQVDSIGGNIDAFTAKECVCFNVKVWTNIFLSPWIF